VAAVEQGAAGGIAIATTYHYSATDGGGGKLWAVRADGPNLPGFPVTLASPASTPPVVNRIGAFWLGAVGCEGGRGRVVDNAGLLVGTSAAVAVGGVTGRLAVVSQDLGGLNEMALGTASGDVVVLSGALVELARWSVAAPGSGFAPDLLWAKLQGEGAN